MVELIYGPPGSGKTDYILSRLAADARQKKRAFLILPEQQTVDAEHSLALRLPPSSQLYIEAINFSRLANRVFRERGGIVYNYVDKSRKLLYMWRAITECSPFLTEYRERSQSDVDLPGIMLNSIKEFKACGITSEMLDSASVTASEISSEKKLSSKLNDLSLIYSAFNTLILQNNSDPSDDLTKLYEMLSQGEPFFKDTSVYIDSFSSFTNQEHNIISLIMKQASDVTVTLPLCSPRDRSIASVSIKNCSDRLRHDASSVGIKPELICLNSSKRGSSPELHTVRESFWRIEATPPNIPQEQRGHIEMYTPSNPYSECDAVAARVKELLMQGYRAKDIAVIAREAESYRGILDCAFEKLDIPYFLSEKTGFSLRPTARLMLSALRIKNYGWKRDDVIAHLKTGLCGIEPRDVDLFDAYTEKWNISGSDFYSGDSWTMNPDGYTARISKRGSETLEAANRVRIFLHDKLTVLFAAIDTAQDNKAVCRAIWEYLESLDVQTTLKELSARELCEGRRRESEETLRLYDSAADALECISDVFGDCKKLDSRMFASVLKMAFDSSEIGTIPTAADEVMIGSANMLRSGEKKCALIIGAVEGEFPGNSSSSGLLTDTDRETLLKLHIPISGNKNEKTSDELFYFWRAASVPSELLCVYAHESSANGSACRPSTAFTRLQLLFPYIKVKTENDFKNIDRLWSVAGGYEYISVLEGTPEGNALLDYFAQNPEQMNLSDEYKLPISAKNDTISPELAEDVFGDRIELTQTRLEAYVSCPCSYYLKYVLCLDSNEDAEFNFADMGSFVHKVLERFFLKIAAGEGFDYEPESEKTSKILDSIIDSYASELCNGKPTPRITHLLSRLRKLSELLISDIFAEIQSSSFKPEQFELPIGITSHGDKQDCIPAASFPLKNGKTISLRGIVDRVDVFRDPNSSKTLIKVVDYKTGSKEFSLDDVKEGYGLQLLIYLYAITKSNSPQVKKMFGYAPSPAAITYLSANIPRVNTDTPLSDEEILKEAKKSIKRSGLVIEDEGIFNALNSNNDPHFMQGVKYTKDGVPSKAIISEKGMDELFLQLEKTISGIADKMYSGNAKATPSLERKNCDYCRYSPFCRTALRKN